MMGEGFGRAQRAEFVHSGAPREIAAMQVIARTEAVEHNDRADRVQRSQAEAGSVDHIEARIGVEHDRVSIHRPDGFDRVSVGGERPVDPGRFDETGIAGPGPFDLGHEVRHREGRRAER